MKDLLVDDSDLRTHYFRFGPDNNIRGVLVLL
jgi:hypothetical protein